MRSQPLRNGLLAAAFAAVTAACGQPGEVPPPAPADGEEVDPIAPPSPPPDADDPGQ